MFRSLWYTLVAIIMFTNAVQAQSTEFKCGKYRMEISVLAHSPSSVTISRLPLELRNVPLHPADGYLRGYYYATTPLPDRPLENYCPEGGEITFLLRPNRFSGFGVSVNFAGESVDRAKHPADRYRQNQWGDDQRIYGASLRWYEATMGSGGLGLTGQLNTPWIHPLPIHEVAVRPLVGGTYDLTGVKINGRAGYDRWGSDQVWKEEVVGHVHRHLLFTGIQVGVADNDVVMGIQARCVWPLFKGSRESNFSSIPMVDRDRAPYASWGVFMFF